jgi:hypothetical protein
VSGKLVKSTSPQENTMAVANVELPSFTPGLLFYVAITDTPIPANSIMDE